MSITLITGPMFCGKTLNLITLANQSKALGHKIVVIKPKIDKRYRYDLVVMAHSGEKIECILADTLSSLFSIVKGLDEVFIDEGQFFLDLVSSSQTMADIFNIHVTIAALNGTAEREPWVNVSALLPHVTKIIWRSDCLCGKCHKIPACFSSRIQPSSSQIDIGGADKYISLCRQCYNVKV